MQTQAETATRASGKGMIWAGRIVSALPILFLTFDSVIKLIKIQAVNDAMAQLGYPDSLSRPLGALLLACVLVYVIPQTSVLGAILLTGYLGGAVATHLRHQDPLFSHVLFPVYVGVLVWLGIFLRDKRIRALVPIRRWNGS